MKKLLPIFAVLGLILVFYNGFFADDKENTENSSNLLIGDILGSNGLSLGDASTPNYSLADLQAQEMRLEHFSGELSLTNMGEVKTPVAGSRLVTEDNLMTQASATAYVMLDSVKAIRLDSLSEIILSRLENKYQINLLEGSLFFNVNQSLYAEESLEFVTNNVVTGVRGTSGIITVRDNVTQIAILSGTVVGTTVEEEKNINAGEVGIITTMDDGTVDFEILSLTEDEPKFFISDDFIDTIQGDGNLFTFPYSEAMRNPYGDYHSLYASVIAQYRDYQYKDIFPTGNAYFNASPSSAYVNSDTVFAYSFYDLNNDGIMEIVFYYVVSYSFSTDINLTYTEIYTLNDFIPTLVSSAREHQARASILKLYDTDPMIIYRVYNTDTAPTTFFHFYYHMIDNQLVEIPEPDNKDDLELIDPAELHLIQPEEETEQNPSSSYGQSAQGTVLVNSQTHFGVEDTATGQLHLITHNSPMDICDMYGVNLGDDVYLYYEGSDILDVDRMAKGGDKVGAYLGIDQFVSEYFDRTTSPIGTWEFPDDYIYFFDLSNATNLTQAEKEAFILRRREYYSNEADLRLGTWEDVQAVATTPLHVVEYGADYYDDIGIMYLRIMDWQSNDYETDFQVSLSYGWSGYFVRCVLDPDTGVFSYESMGGVS